MSQLLATNIATIRRCWGLEQTEFAELMGVSRFVVSNWEKGRNEPNLAIAAKLEQMTGLSLSVLLDQELRGQDIPEKPGEIHLKVNVGERLERIEGMLQRLVGK